MSFPQLFAYFLCQVLSIAIFARAILSWFPVNPGNQLVAFLYQITEPILATMRRIIPRLGMFDLTPMIVFFVLQMTAGVIAGL
ncbi:MAG: YggT family protein [Dehalococcoidia bacterium]|nr:YggT family protein [Dehalococcoidia bacterium]